MGVLYLMCWRRNYPQDRGTRPQRRMVGSQVALPVLSCRRDPSAASGIAQCKKHSRAYGTHRRERVIQPGKLYCLFGLLTRF
jgi:hypothetical protein